MPDPAGPNIRLVVFDIGRVLIRICDDWADAARRAGIDSPLPTLDDRAGAILHDAVHRIDIGQLDLIGFIAITAPLFGLTPAQIRATSDAYLIAAFAGGIELIDDLHAAGIATACLSNTNESHWKIMNDPASPAHFPLHRLTHRFASHLVGARKPDPAIYEHVERETGASPREIIFFDDLPENITAARERHWHTFHVLPQPDVNPMQSIRDELRRCRVI